MIVCEMKQGSLVNIPEISVLRYHRSATVDQFSFFKNNRCKVRDVGSSNLMQRVEQLELLALSSAECERWFSNSTPRFYL